MNKGSFSLNVVCDTKVQEIKNSICANKANGLDVMPAKFLKNALTAFDSHH